MLSLVAKGTFLPGVSLPFGSKLNLLTSWRPFRKIHLKERNPIYCMCLRSGNITLYLRERSYVCIHVFTLHDQILEHRFECDKASVVKCGSLENKTSKWVGACLTYADICRCCTHLEKLISCDKCVNKASMHGDCINIQNLCLTLWIPGNVWIWLFSILLSCSLLFKNAACSNVYVTMCVHLTVRECLWEVDWYSGPKLWHWPFSNR